MTSAVCKKRLTQRARPESLASWIGMRRAFLIRVRGERFRLRYRSATLRSAFSPVFYGTLEAENAGTRIHGEFRLHPLVRAFVWVWVSFVVIMGALLCVLSASALWRAEAPAFHASYWVGLIAGPALLWFGFLLMRYGRQTHEREITRFLLMATDSRLVSPDSVRRDGNQS